MDNASKLFKGLNKTKRGCNNLIQFLSRFIQRASNFPRKNQTKRDSCENKMNIQLHAIPLRSASRRRRLRDNTRTVMTLLPSTYPAPFRASGGAVPGTSGSAATISPRRARHADSCALPLSLALYLFLSQGNGYCRRRRRRLAAINPVARR